MPRRFGSPKCEAPRPQGTAPVLEKVAPLERVTSHPRLLAGGAMGQNTKKKKKKKLFGSADPKSCEDADGEHLSHRHGLTWPWDSSFTSSAAGGLASGTGAVLQGSICSVFSTFTFTSSRLRAGAAASSFSSLSSR